MNNHGNDKEIKFLQYNILAQTLINRRTKFSYCSKKSGRWNHRRQNLLGEILAYDPCVMTLQEVDYYDEYWRDVLERNGYSSVYTSPKKMEKGEENAKYGLVVAVKSADFEILSAKSIDFQEVLSSDSERDYSVPLSLFDRIEMEMLTNCAQIVLLRHRVHNYFLVVANTHLSWRHEFKYTRLRQVHALLKTLRDDREVFEREYNCTDHIPIIMGCDLNDLPHNPIYSYITDERRIPTFHESRNHNALQVYLRLKYSLPEYLKRIAHERIKNESAGEDLEHFLAQQLHSRISHMHSVIELSRKQNLPLFTSVYSQYTRHIDQISKYKWNTNEIYGVVTGGEYEPEYTNYVNGFSETLDYIFVERSEKLAPVKILKLPHESEITASTALPNEAYSSDHIGLMCVLKIM